MYKNFTANICTHSCNLKKFLLIMKITTFIVFLAFMQVSASVFSQKITFKQDNVTLKQFFNEVNKQTGYNVFWSPRGQQKSYSLDVDLNNAQLDDALKTVLKQFQLTFLIDGK